MVVVTGVVLFDDVVVVFLELIRTDEFFERSTAQVLLSETTPRELIIDELFVP